MSAQPQRRKQQPWSMKWIVLAIALFVIGYTLVNVLYRKPGRAFRPYEDMNKRATTARLLSAGWQKLPVDFRQPTEKPALGLHASVKRGPPGLGPELEAAFAEKPVLLTSVSHLTAPQTITRGASYGIYFNGRLQDQHLQIAHVEALLRGQEIVLVPVLERLPGKDLLTRWNDSEYWAGLDTSRLAAGRYDVRFVSQDAAIEWSVEVTP